MRVARLFRPSELSRVLLASAVTLGLVSPMSALGQFPTSGIPTPSNNGGGGARFADTADTAAVSFGGVTFELARLIRDPETKGYKAILKVTETQSPRRSVAFVPPQSTLVDDMGNIYALVSATGVRICGYRNDWDSQIDRCARRGPEDFNQMATGVAMPVTMLFAPGDQTVVEETLDHATSATLYASVGILGEDKKAEKVDIIVTNVPLP